MISEPTSKKKKGKVVVEALVESMEPDVPKLDKKKSEAASNEKPAKIEPTFYEK